MEQKRKTRTWCGFLLLLVLLAVFLIWNLLYDAVAEHIDCGELVKLIVK